MGTSKASFLKSAGSLAAPSSSMFLKDHLHQRCWSQLCNTNFISKLHNCTMHGRGCIETYITDMARSGRYKKELVHAKGNSANKSVSRMSSSCIGTVVSVLRQYLQIRY